MPIRFYIAFLLVSFAAADKATERRSGGGQPPVKIWSINAELDMNQQTADVHVRGPNGVQAERDNKQYIIRLSNSKQQSQTQNDENAVMEPSKERSREEDPAPSNRQRPKATAVITSVCCQGCEAPLAVNVLHRIAQVIGMVVVFSMWLLLTVLIVIMLR